MAKELENLVFTINIEGSEQARNALEKIKDAFNNTAKGAEKADSKVNQWSLALNSMAVAAGTLAAQAITGLSRQLYGLAQTLAVDVIKEGMEGEKTFIELSAAIERAGLSVETALPDLDDFATSLAKVTKFTDDEIKSAEAMALSLGMTSDEIKNSFSVAADLATAKGSSLKDAVVALSKSYAGNAGPLQRLMPELKDFTEEQLKAGAAVEYVRKAFGGAALAEIKTFAGGIGQLKKVWGDILETIGTPIINTLKPVLADFSNYLSQFIGASDLTKFGQEIADGITDALAWIINFVWFLQGKPSYFSNYAGWDLTGGLFDRILIVIKEVTAKLSEIFFTWASDPKTTEAMLYAGIKIGSAIAQGVLTGLYKAMLGKHLDKLGASMEYLSAPLMGAPISMSWPEYAKSKGIEEYKNWGEKAVKPAPSTPSAIPPQSNNSTQINQDVKIFTNGESAEALQRQLRSALPKFQTNVLA